MQPEYESMRPDGVSNQMYRFNLANHNRASEAILDVVPDTRLCWPDVIIGGMSLEMHD